MCGIAGWTDFERNLTGETAVIGQMTATLSPRGPDAAGCWLDTHVALGHRRLVVVDPGGGRQPMVCRAGDDTYVLVYNGELYNTEDIRRELTALGHTFTGWSDTEVLLRAYIEWEESCLQKFNGIFAFAVWDGRRQRLFLARDRIGVKPLFYSRRGSSFLFASEIKALLAHPLVTPVIDREGLAEILVMGPARTPGHGVFAQIAELKPGWCLTVTRDGIRLRPYWSLVSAPHTASFAATAEAVRELVLDAVQRQLVADVPLATLLSGGLDSSAITAIAAAHYERAGKAPLRTFSVDYADNETYFRTNEFQPAPDAPWVKLVSETYRTTHRACTLAIPQLVAALFPAVLARDLPGMADIDASLLLFSRDVKEEVTVALSGEGADEVFGGYPWFYRQTAGKAAHQTFPWTRHAAARFRLYAPEVLAAIRPEAYLAARFEEALAEVPRLAGEPAADAGMRALFYLNLTRWMPTLLDRKDRMSMAAGLELRVPFTDHRLVAYLWNVPWAYKNYLGREKGLLRQALTEILPASVLWRKKSPYPKTHHPAYLAAVRRLLLDILADRDSPLLPLVNAAALRDFALSATTETDIPWFGQLMNAPQLLAYLVQVDYWLRAYKVRIQL